MHFGCKYPFFHSCLLKFFSCLMTECYCILTVCSWSFVLNCYLCMKLFSYLLNFIPDLFNLEQFHDRHESQPFFQSFLTESLKMNLDCFLHWILSSCQISFTFLTNLSFIFFLKLSDFLMVCWIFYHYFCLTRLLIFCGFYLLFW